MMDSLQCGCVHTDAEHDVTSDGGISRRSVVRAAATGSALAALGGLSATNARFAFAESLGAVNVVGAASLAQQRQVLVVISLRGGFDGLSAIVPASDPGYARARPNVAIPASTLIKLNTTFGMHPAMAPLLPFWKARTFGAIHAVGQANPSRSHFSAMAEMERAAPGTALRTGWLDRLLGVIPNTTAFGATQLGRPALLGSLIGPMPELALGSLKDFILDAAGSSATQRARWLKALNTLHAGAANPVVEPARAATTALTRTAAMGTTYTPANGAKYPAGQLGDALRDTARLIKAKVGLRISAIDYGEWDLHAGMGTVRVGSFTEQLRELSLAMAAFATDMGSAKMQDVTVITLSEFGRRVAENGSGGTDHGFGNAVLMLGGGVVGGKVHGRWPGLGAAALVDGDLAGTTDYRLLLSEIVTKRFGADGAGKIFPGVVGQPLGIVGVPT